MKNRGYVYLVISIAPTICVLLAQGPMTSRGIFAGICAIILSPLLTAIGLMLGLDTKPPVSRIYWIGAALAALPEIYLLIAIPRAR